MSVYPYTKSTVSIREGTMASPFFNVFPVSWTMSRTDNPLKLNITWMNNVLKFYMSQTEHSPTPSFPKPGSTSIFIYHPSSSYIPHAHISSKSWHNPPHFLFFSSHIFILESSVRGKIYPLNLTKYFIWQTDYGKSMGLGIKLEVGSSHSCFLITKWFWTSYNLRSLVSFPLNGFNSINLT